MSSRSEVLTAEQIGVVIARLRERHLLAHAETIAKSHNVSLEEMISKTHRADAVRARHHLWATLHGPRHSYSSIGLLFEYDHSTVISGVKKHRALEVAAELSHYEHERLNGIEARLDALERLSDRLAKACDAVELLAIEMRRAS